MTPRRAWPYGEAVYFGGGGGGVPSPHGHSTSYPVGYTGTMSPNHAPQSKPRMPRANSKFGVGVGRALVTIFTFGKSNPIRPAIDEGLVCQGEKCQTPFLQGPQRCSSKCHNNIYASYYYHNKSFAYRTMIVHLTTASRPLLLPHHHSSHPLIVVHCCWVWSEGLKRLK